NAAAGENSKLLGGRKADAFAEDLHPVAGDAAEQAVIDGDQDPHGGAAVSIQQRDKLVGGEVILLRADRQRGKHAALPFGHGAARGKLAQFVDVLAELIQQVDGKIDAAALDVFLDVAEDVGELERDAGLLGELFGARVGVAEDADADKADDRGDEVAVAVEVLEGCVGLHGGRTGLGGPGGAGNQFFGPTPSD